MRFSRNIHMFIIYAVLTSYFLVTFFCFGWYAFKECSFRDEVRISTFNHCISIYSWFEQKRLHHLNIVVWIAINAVVKIVQRSSFCDSWKFITSLIVFSIILSSISLQEETVGIMWIIRDIAVGVNWFITLETFCTNSMLSLDNFRETLPLR